MDETIEEFLNRNEETINKFLSIFTICLVPFIPLVFLLKKIGFLPLVETYNLVILWIFLIFFSIHYFFFSSREITPKLRKYVLMLVLEGVAFLVSITKGMNVYLCYGSVVLITCLYFNVKFTGIISGLSYILMVVSYIIRNDNLLPGFYIGEPKVFSTSMIIGSSMEYCAYATMCLYLSKNVRNILISIYNNRKSIRESQNSMIEGFANLIEAKDSNTGGHIKRTSEYVRLICNGLMKNDLYPSTITPQTTEILVRAAPFHDIGKIAIPEELLNKTGKLTEEEFEIIKKHPTIGAEFITQKLSMMGDDELLKTARQMALCHHEYIDGSGYPNGLKGEEIPVAARIMAVADILDALLSKRSYKTAYSINKSMQIIKGMAGKLLDPIVIYVLLEAEDEINKILEESQ